MDFLTFLAGFIAEVLGGRLRRWLTFRRVLGIAAVLVMLLFLKELVGIGFDLTFLFGLDLGLAVEVSALLIILGVRDQAVMMVTGVRRKLLLLKPVGLARRRGVRRAIRARAAKPLLPPSSDDEPAAAWAFA